MSSRTFFNYFPSKAAAALQLQEATIDPAVEAAFGSARGTLVMALCDVIGNTADRGPSMIGVKPLLGRHPELMPTATQMMLEAREMFITVALQRSRDRAQAELAVTLVMAAFSRIMRDGSNSDTPLAEQLKATVEQILALGLEEMPS